MKKRYKLILGTFVSFCIVTLIFIITKDRKVYYLSLGDSLAAGQTPYKTIDKSYGDYFATYLDIKHLLEFYTKDFSKSGYRTIDLLNDIKNNKSIKINDKDISIKNALIKADIVTLSIGANDLFYKLNFGNTLNDDTFDDIYKYVDEVIIDIDKLLNELRLNCKERIMIFNFYNPFVNSNDTFANMIEPVILYANQELNKIVTKYKMDYIDIHKEFLNNPDYLPKTFEIHPTKSGYEAMSNKIIELFNKNLQNS